MTANEDINLINEGLDEAWGAAIMHGRTLARIYLGQSDEDLEEHRAIVRGVLGDVRIFEQLKGRLDMPAG